MIAASLPSPSQGVWWIGPIPLRAYGLLIMLGMLVAVWWSAKRYAKRGGDPEVLYDVAMWAIPFGIVGARIYHVCVTAPHVYFAPGADLLKVLYIWEGGIGIWGGITGGALGVWLALKRRGARLGPVADSIAPTLLVAQAIGRWGNWFNQELFGSPTTLPWGLEIDDAHLPAGYASGTLFHPTFLYESLWNIAAAAAIVYLERRMKLVSGQMIGMYLIAYSVGRMWMEILRIDPANTFLGMRLHFWTSLVGLTLGAAIFAIAGKKGAPATLAPGEGGTKAAAADASSIEDDESNDE